MELLAASLETNVEHVIVLQGKTSIKKTRTIANRLATIAPEESRVLLATGKYIGEFQAVDRPLTDMELKYAKKQSTRAEISRWSFRNEYHYGDFRGDVNGLLRRGYDVHLHYANFGVRTVAFRLSAGLPFPQAVWPKYIGLESLDWQKDCKGTGGVLSLDPYHESGKLEEIWDRSFDEYIDNFVEIRNRLVADDLRMLYLLWLCAVGDNSWCSCSVSISKPNPA